MDRVFYSIWKNKYIRNYIKNKVCQDLVIEIKSIKELQDDHRLISLFTEQDKRDNNIYIRLIINDEEEYDQYIKISSDNNQCQQLVVVDDICLKTDIDLNFNMFHQGIKRIEMFIYLETKITGRLPQSLTELVVKSQYVEIYNQSLDNVLMNIPASLRKLTLPLYKFTKRVELPSTLECLNYTTRISDINNLVMPPNKVYEGYQVVVNSLDQLQLVHNLPWVHKLQIRQVRTTLKHDHIPSHIKHLSLDENGFVEDDSFPQGLLSLTIAVDIPINISSLPRCLTHLDINSYGYQLKKGMLPPTLKKLQIYHYFEPLVAGALPDGLTSLSLPRFNQELDVKALPSSLTELDLDYFTKELKPFALPPHLKSLNLNKYSVSYTEPNCLPNTLTSLKIFQISGPIEYAPQMNHLTYLSIGILNQSVVRMIENCNNITLDIKSIDPNVNLQDTHIHLINL